MDTRILITLFLLLSALSGCGNNAGGDMPLPDGWSSPADGSSSGSSSNSSTSGSGSGAVSGTGVPAKSGQQFTTDSGTHFYVTKHQTLSLPSTEFFKGGTAFGSYIYILTNQYLSGSTTIWKIYRVTPSTLSSAVQCTWYETSTLTGGLATDGTYFYIWEDPTPQTSFGLMFRAVANREIFICLQPLITRSFRPLR